MLEGLAGITLGQLFGWVVGLIAAISIVIEKSSKIKFAPITKVLKWIGRKANGELFEQVNTLEAEIISIKNDAAKRNAISCRAKILSFGDELRRGVLHSEESFTQILEFIDIYEKYCNEHPEFKNNKAIVTISMILNVYAECVRDNKFL